jgi:hypothetical protein
MNSDSRGMSNTASTFLLCFSATILSGCAHHIVLPGLFHAVPDNLPALRRLSSASRLEDGSPNPHYKLAQSDQVEFKWNDDAKGKWHDILIFISNNAPCPASGMPAGGTDKPLVEGMRPRLSMAVLSRVNEISLSDPDDATKTIPVTLCGPGNKFLFDPADSPTWSTVEEKLTPQLKGKVSIRFVPSGARRVMPGDVVRTTLEWSSTSGVTHPNSVAQVQSTVDSEGRALVPGLSSPTLPATKQPNGLQREWISELDGIAFELELWKRGRSFSKQPTLQSISSCLAGIWDWKDAKDPKHPDSPNPDNPDSLNGEIDECVSNGVDNFHFADVAPPATLGANNQRVRYQIDVDQHWSLISEKGSRLEQTYFPGETLKAGIAKALRQMTGDDFPTSVIRHDGKIFVVVVPRAELGYGENLPFWIRVKKGEVHELESILIAPGDTIYLTLQWPRAEEP